MVRWSYVSLSLFSYVFYLIFFPLILVIQFLLFLFFFHAPATTEIYTLSLHDALPICALPAGAVVTDVGSTKRAVCGAARGLDRKSTRLNSSHVEISYAVFCLKKKIGFISHIVGARTCISAALLVGLR